MKYLKRFNESRTEAIEDCLLELTDLPYNFEYEVNKNGEIKLVGHLPGESAFFYMEVDWDGKLNIIKNSIGNTTDGILISQRKPASQRAIELQQELLSVLPSVLRKLNRDVVGPQVIEVCINSYSVSNEGTAAVRDSNTEVVVILNY